MGIVRTSVVGMFVMFGYITSAACDEASSFEKYVGTYDTNGGRCDDLFWELMDWKFSMKASGRVLMNRARHAAAQRHPGNFQMGGGKIEASGKNFIMKGWVSGTDEIGVRATLYIFPDDRGDLKIAYETSNSKERREIPGTMKRCQE